MVWLLKGSNGRVALVDSGFHHQKFLDQWKPRDFRSPAAADRRGVMHRLDITMTFGAVLPDAVTASQGSSVPVVLVGTVSGAADGCGNVDRCDQRFEIDRLVWACVRVNASSL
jgi:hypothetical protein